MSDDHPHHLLHPSAGLVCYVLAAITFAVGLFGGHIFDLNLTYLGLLLFVLGHII